MIVKPKVRGFICTTAHPLGCEQNIQEQIGYAKAQGAIAGPRRVLVIGSSTGYGLACRIAAAFCCEADTIGVFFERPSSGNRTATAGWYNNLAFEKAAAGAGRLAKSINGDAFSTEVKEQAVEMIRKDMPGGKVDLIIYSLAAPKRTDPVTGQVYNSVIKPIGKPFTGKTVDFHTGQVSTVEIAPAVGVEISDTVAVMGGGDWRLWMEALQNAGVLADCAATLAFSYLGPVLTHGVYKDGTIGKAKEDLDQASRQIDALLSPIGGKSFVSINKALITQASSAIPVVPLYISLLFKVMKAKGTHEDCIQQMVRMFATRLYGQGLPVDWSKVDTDEEGRIRMDDWEMEPDVQQQVEEAWQGVTTGNVETATDLAGYRDDFYRLFGFGLTGVDYEDDIEQL